MGGKKEDRRTTRRTGRFHRGFVGKCEAICGAHEEEDKERAEGRRVERNQENDRQKDREAKRRGDVPTDNSEET